MLNAKSDKSYVLVSALFFVVAAVIGFIFARFNPTLTSQIMESLARRYQPLARSDSSTVFLYIFINNSVIDFIAIITFFLFGLVPLYLLYTNGFTLGLVVSASSEKLSPLKIAAAILPHGIFEVPSFLIATGIGLWLNIKFIKKILRNEPFKEPFIHSLKIFFVVVLSLNLVAALIEVYVTPLIYSLL